MDPSILYIGKLARGLTWHVVLSWSESVATWPVIKVAVGALGGEATRTVAAKLNEEVWLNRAGGRIT
jgi:hypothetical protein